MFDSKTTRLYPADSINVFMGYYDRLRAPPQKSIFVQESPNELKFAEYVDTSSE